MCRVRIKIAAIASFVDLRDTTEGDRGQLELPVKTLYTAVRGIYVQEKET